MYVDVYREKNSFLLYDIYIYICVCVYMCVYVCVGITIGI